MINFSYAFVRMAIQHNFTLCLIVLVNFCNVFYHHFLTYIFGRDAGLKVR